MTLAVVPLALVSTYRSTGVPSAVLPKSIFWMPISTLPPPFARGSSAAPGELQIQRTQSITPPHTEDVCMDRLLVVRLAQEPFTLNLAITRLLIQRRFCRISAR